MIKLIFTFFLSAFAFSLIAQKNDFAFFRNMNGERLIVADTAILHISPSDGAAIEDTLLQGMPIKILMRVPYIVSKNNIVCPWLKIMYKKGEFNKVAFIAATDVALNEKLTNKNYTIFWGYSNATQVTSTYANGSTESGLKYFCKLLVYNENGKVAEQKFMIEDSTGLDSFSITKIENVKLKNVQAAIALNCYSNTKKNIENVNYNFAVCNSNIVQLPTLFKHQQQSDNYYNFLNLSYKRNVFAVCSFNANCNASPKQMLYKWENCSYSLIENK